MKIKCTNLFCANYTKKIDNKYNCKLEFTADVKTCKHRKNFNWFYRNIFLLVNNKIIIDQNHALKIKMKLQKLRKFWQRKLL